MAEETIKISVVATGFDQVQKGLDNTSKALDNTSKAATSAGKALGSQLNSASGQATNTLVNLNRVVQDAPYGFIGIANNINPLVESFGRLKAESGSTGGAFKALLSSLTGPAGIGIAVAAVTTAITFAQIGFQRWGASAQKAKQETDDFNKGLRDAEQGAKAQGIRLEGLTKIITNTAASERDRNLALAEANKLLEPYGQKIDSINISVEKAAKLTSLYTEALVNQAIGTKLADKIADLRIKKTELENRIIVANNNLKNLKINLSKEEINLNTGLSKSSGQLVYAEQYLNDAKTELLNTTKQIDNYTSQYNATVIKSLKVDEDSSKKTNKKKKDIETYLDVIKKLNESVKDQVNIQVGLTGVTGEDPSTLKERINLYLTAIKRLISEFNIDPKSKIIVDLKSELNELEFVNKAQENFKKAESAVKAFKPTINVPILPNVDINKPIPLPKNIVDFTDSAKQFLSNASVDIATSFAEGLSSAITGAASFQNVFIGILSVLGQAVQSFGKELIKLGTLALIAKLSIDQALANPYALIAAGIALTAFGAMLSNINKKQAFAVGTNYAPGGMALVGERGPEMVSLPRGAIVTPAAQTAQMMGGAMQQVEVFGVLRGQDIYFSNKKYSQTYRRTT